MLEFLLYLIQSNVPEIISSDNAIENIVHLALKNLYFRCFKLGDTVSWLRQYATDRKIASLRADEVIDFFQFT
jgi:hypothetical protein